MNNLPRFLILTAMVFILTACNLSNSSKVEVGKLRVKEEYVTKAYDLHKFNDNLARVIVNEVLKQSSDEKVVVNISYLKGDDGNRVLMQQEGKFIKQSLNQHGLENVEIVTIAVDDSKSIGKLVIYYKTKVVLAPEGCTEIAGVKGAVNIGAMDNYSIGCNSKMMFSKMIANPDDLLGTDRYSEVESRRAGATVEKYKSGEPNEKIQGMNASQIDRQ